MLEVQNTLAGLLAEIIKKSWTINDDPKTEQKERMKAVSLISACYDRRECTFVRTQADDLNEYTYTDKIKKAKKGIDKKRKSIIGFS